MRKNTMDFNASDLHLLNKVYEETVINIDTEEITHLQPSCVMKIFTTLLEFACLSQNVGNIIAARKFFKIFPLPLLDQYLPVIIDNIVDLEDDYEYRRLLELLKENSKQLFTAYIEMGLGSSNNDIRVAAHDFRVNIDE